MPFDTPLAVKPAPVTVTPDTVMVEFPLFVSIVESWLGVFRFTVPKPKLVGFAPNTRVAATPVPLKLIVSEEGVPLVVSTMEPVTLVGEPGVKIAFKVAVAPAAIVVDVEIPELLKPEAAPVVLTWENLSVEVPPFLRVMGCESLFPTTTLAKATLAGFAEICA